MKLLPPRRVLCMPYNQTPCHFMQSHIRKVHAYLAVTCHPHFWQNDRGISGATAVTRGWNGYRNKSQHRTEDCPWRRKFSRRSCRDSNPRPFDHESGALTTELSPLPRCWVPERKERTGFTRSQSETIIIIDTFCIALFSVEHKLTALYNISPICSKFK